MRQTGYFVPQRWRLPLLAAKPEASVEMVMLLQKGEHLLTLKSAFPKCGPRHDVVYFAKQGDSWAPPRPGESESSEAVLRNLCASEAPSGKSENHLGWPDQVPSSHQSLCPLGSAGSNLLQRVSTLTAWEKSQITTEKLVFQSLQAAAVPTGMCESTGQVSSISRYLSEILNRITFHEHCLWNLVQTLPTSPLSHP